jgi:hypothetical protein
MTRIEARGAWTPTRLNAATIGLPPGGAPKTLRLRPTTSQESGNASRGRVAAAGTLRSPYLVAPRPCPPLLEQSNLG